VNSIIGTNAVNSNNDLMNSFVRILNLVLINLIVNNKLDGAKVQQLSLLAMNKKLCTNEKCQIKNAIS
jgi:hypothetical protein